MTIFILVPQYVQRELRNYLYQRYPKLRNASTVIFYEESFEEKVYFYARVEFTLGDTFVRSFFRYAETQEAQRCEYGWHWLRDDVR